MGGDSEAKTTMCRRFEEYLDIEATFIYNLALIR
jgi:hypothetical protein